MKLFFKLLTLSGLLSSVMGCMPHTDQYPASAFSAPARVVEKRVAVPVLPKVKATYGIGDDPAVVEAYRRYTQTGQRATVRSNGWITYPYSTETKPMMACSTLHFCIVQLESGEKLNSMSLGDKNNWLSNVFLTGEGPTASISIQLTPKLDNLATDLTVSTDKRTYLVGLVAKPGAETAVLRFYYPEETYLANVQAAKGQQSDNNLNANNSDVVTQGPAVNLEHLNFNYQISGDNAPWKPTRVFDDANKTYIQMPPLTAHVELPVLYLMKGKQTQMVNYRYNQPYFMVDGLFSRAILVTGKGTDQTRVTIINQNLAD